MKIKNGKSILLDDSSDENTISWRNNSETETTVVDSHVSATGVVPAGDDLKPRGIDLTTEKTPFEEEEGTKTTLLDGDAQGAFCVGWLLCVSGPMKGNSYPLRIGRNSVGRNYKNAVCLANDDSISREAQIYVVYDPEENEYAVTPGSGSAISRLNKKRLDQAVSLAHGDVITLSSQTSLRFIPACDDTFRWDT